MTDEIKEILDKLETVAGKHTIEVREDGSKIERMSAYAVNELRLNNFSSKILLDYITNLQERKITKEDVDKYFEENMCVSFDKFIENWNEQEEWANYYKKENERLNAQIKKRNVINEYISNDYRLRNKKAIENIDLVIELIKQQSTEDDSWILNKLNGFKYLLNGGDKE